MNITKILLITLCISILMNCNAYKSKFKLTDDVSDVIHFAISDFSKTSPLFKKDSIFSVNVNKSFDSTKYVIEIIGDDMKILVNDSIMAMIGLNVKTIPTRYLVIENRLFIWWDDDFPLTQEALDIYEKYNLLQDDEGGWVKFPDFYINDSKKGVDYYFCKNNLTIYKKVTTNIGLGYYDPPVLNCK